MRRFFFESDGRYQDMVDLPEAEARHISRVLRLTPGDKVELLDGAGTIYAAELLETGKRVRAQITGVVTEHITPVISLMVCQGQLKGQKMDTVIQKCTELGVRRLAPFWSSRCQGKLDDLQGAKKLSRYQRIVEAASKQCCRADLMTVDPPLEFDELLRQFQPQDGRLLLLFWEEERDCSLHDIVIPDTASEVILLLGPEGGLTVEEVEAARLRGWVTLSLGSRILRAETATLTATSIMQFMVKNI